MISANDKYNTLKKLINEWVEREKENYDEAKKSGGVDCCGACLALGALDAYQQVLGDIKELERKVVIND